MLGFGERTGNPPIEGLIIDYVSLKGGLNGVNTQVITEIADYFKKVIKVEIPKNYPFVGDEFNVTMAGIHADGGIKDERIYNIFDTRKLLNRPLGVGITDKSGTAGVAYWINNFFNLKGKDAVDKASPDVLKIHEWVTHEYENQRITGISNQEMMELTKKYLPNLFSSELEILKAKAKDLAYELILEVVKKPEIVSMEPAKQEPVMQALADDNFFVKLVYITDISGKKITKNITQKKDAELYHQKLQEYGVFSDRAWFQEAIKNKKVYFTDLYTSKITGLLCITVSAPIFDKNDNLIGVLGIDIKFDDLI